MKLMQTKNTMNIWSNIGQMRQNRKVRAGVKLANFVSLLSWENIDVAMQLAFSKRRLMWLRQFQGSAFDLVLDVVRDQLKSQSRLTSDHMKSIMRKKMIDYQVYKNVIAGAKTRVGSGSAPTRDRLDLKRQISSRFNKSHRFRARRVALLIGRAERIIPPDCVHAKALGRVAEVMQHVQAAHEMPKFDFGWP